MNLPMRASIALALFASVSAEATPPAQAQANPHATASGHGGSGTSTGSIDNKPASSNPSKRALRQALVKGEPFAVSPLAVEATRLRERSAYAAPTRYPAGDPHVRMLGGRWLKGLAAPYDRFMIGQSITVTQDMTPTATGLPPRSMLNAGIAFTLPSGQSEFEVVVQGVGSRQPFMLFVDGKAVNGGGFLAMDGVNDGGAYYLRFRLPATTQERAVELDFNNRGYLGLNLPQGLSLGDIRKPRASVVFQGDSITVGAFATRQQFGFPLQAAYRLGIDDPVVVGVGGTGYLRDVPDRRTFGQRLGDVVAAIDGGPPDAVVVAGGHNDCVTAQLPPAQVGQAALSYFRALRAAAPQMQIFVVAPFTTYNLPNYGPFMGACRDAIFAAAAQVSDTYVIDVSTWVTPENRDAVFGDPANSPHPTDYGHALYGERLAEAMKRVIGNF